MKAARTVLVAVAIAALSAVGSGQTTSGGEPEYTKKQIKEMMRDAHTPEQYRALAEWFRTQEQMFHENAIAEKKEWEQRVGGYKVDPARNLYDYYVEQEKEMSARAENYERWSRQ